MIKEVSTQTRKAKSDEEIVDVELLDNSMTKPDSSPRSWSASSGQARSSS